MPQPSRLCAVRHGSSSRVRCSPGAGRAAAGSDALGSSAGVHHSGGIVGVGLGDMGDSAETSGEGLAGDTDAALTSASVVTAHPVSTTTSMATPTQADAVASNPNLCIPAMVGLPIGRATSSEQLCQDATSGSQLRERCQSAPHSAMAPGSKSPRSGLLQTVTFASHCSSCDRRSVVHRSNYGQKAVLLTFAPSDARMADPANRLTRGRLTGMLRGDHSADPGARKPHRTVGSYARSPGTASGARTGANRCTRTCTHECTYVPLIDPAFAADHPRDYAESHRAPQTRLIDSQT